MFASRQLTHTLRLSPHAAFPASGMQIIYKVSISKARLAIPKDPSVCPPELASLLVNCWKGRPKKRPTAVEILAQIEVALEGMP